MSAPDNFKFAEIPPASTPDEARIVELVRATMREEFRRRDEAFNAVVLAANRAWNATRSPA